MEQEKNLKLSKALLEFQRECPVLQKTSRVKVRTKSGGEYSYKYVDLPTIHEVIMPLLTKNGIVVRQPVSNNGDRISITTILIHAESGESINDCMDFQLSDIKQDMNIIQSLGSIITYLRRYCLCCSLNLVADEDDDASNLPKNPVEKPDETIVLTVKNCTTIDCLKEIWESNSELQTKKWFKKLINDKKEIIKTV